MTNSAFASFLWNQVGADPCNWMQASQWDATGTSGPPSKTPGMPPINTATEIKMISNQWFGAATAICIVDSNVGGGGSGDYTTKVSVNGTLYINNAASYIGFKKTGKGNGLRVGSAGTGGGKLPTGTVEQTAGRLVATDLYLGYYGTMQSGDANVGTGYYVISGESFLTITEDPVTDLVHTGGLSVRSGVNETAAGQKTIGKFTVIGPEPTIDVTALVVGGNINGAANTTNKGTLEFKLGSGVSPINCDSVTLDVAGDLTTADLVVTLTNNTAPPEIIVLAVNDGVDAVSGTFDSVSGDQNGGRAVERDQVVLLTPNLTSYTHYMSYRYNAEAGTFGNGNDIALVPEPATIALFGLSLLALVRRPRRK